MAFLSAGGEGLRAYRNDATIVMDATGLGRPVVEMARRRIKPWPQAVTITSGSATTGDAIGWRVPKQDLIGVVQVALQNRTLKICTTMPMTKALVSELKGYHYEQSASGTVYSNDPRRAAHDDLVIATALAVWWANRLPYHGNGAGAAAEMAGIKHYPAVPSANLPTGGSMGVIRRGTNVEHGGSDGLTNPDGSRNIGVGGTGRERPPGMVEGGW